MICRTCRALLRQRLPMGSLSTRVQPFSFQTPRLPLSTRIPTSATRTFSSAAAAEDIPPASTNDAEAAIASVLQSALEPSELVVRDVSGGCGSMYAIEIASPKFRGLTVLKQQRLVNSALGDMVKAWHGVQLRTKPTPE